MAIFCNRCGTGLPHSARFCSNCGATVTGAPATPVTPLYRPFAGRQIAGVCLALSRTYGFDLALTRILTVVGFFFSGGIVAVGYLACWIGIPEEPIGMPPTPAAPTAYPPNV